MTSHTLEGQYEPSLCRLIIHHTHTHIKILIQGGSKPATLGKMSYYKKNTYTVWTTVFISWTNPHSSDFTSLCCWWDITAELQTIPCSLQKMKRGEDEPEQKKKKTTAKRKQERVSGNGPGLKGFSGSPSRSSTAICNVKCIMHRPQSWHFSKLLSCLINTVGWPPAVRAEQCAVLRNWSSTRAQIHYGFIKSHTYSSDSSASANVFISIKTIHIVPSLLDYVYFNFFFTMSVWT